MKNKFVNLTKEKIIITNIEGFLDIKLLKNGDIIALNEKKIIIFNKDNYDYKVIFEETNEDDIYDLVELSNNRFCYSIYKYLKIIQLSKDNQYKIIQVLSGHIDDVYTILSINDNYLISSSMDKTIKIWKYIHKNQKYILINSTTMINYGDFDNNNIKLLNKNILIYYSNNFGNGVIKFLNLKKNNIIKTIDIRCKITKDSIIIYDNILLVCENNGYLYLIDLDKYEIIRRFENIFVCSLIKLRNGNILIMEKNDYFKEEYILKEYEILKSFNLIEIKISQTFNYINNILEINDNKLLSINENNDIIIWKNPFIERINNNNGIKKEKTKPKKTINNNSINLKNINNNNKEQYNNNRNYLYFILGLIIFLLAYIIYFFIY